MILLFVALVLLYSIFHIYCIDKKIKEVEEEIKHLKHNHNMLQNCHHTKGIAHGKTKDTK